MGNNAMKRSLLFFMALNLLLAVAVTAQTNVESAYALIKRTVPSHAAKFKVEALPKADSLDAFEIESNGKHIVLRGNNGVAIASALYYYLKDKIKYFKMKIKTATKLSPDSALWLFL